MMVFVILVLSTVTLDGMIETPLWLSLSNWAFNDSGLRPVISALGGTDSQSVISTAGLIALPIVFFAVYAVFSQVMSLALRAKPADGLKGSALAADRSGSVVVASMGLGERPSVVGLARLFVFSLVPIAIAYHLAHIYRYFPMPCVASAGPDLA